MPSICQNLRSAPQKQPRPNTAVLIPSGNGALRGVPSTACLSGTLNAGRSRPGSASVGVTILVLLRLKSTISYLLTLGFSGPKLKLLCDPLLFISDSLPVNRARYSLLRAHLPNRPP